MGMIKGGAGLLIVRTIKPVSALFFQFNCCFKKIYIFVKQKIEFQLLFVQSIEDKAIFPAFT